MKWLLRSDILIGCSCFLIGHRWIVFESGLYVKISLPYQIRRGDDFQYSSSFLSLSS